MQSSQFSIPASQQIQTLKQLFKTFAEYVSELNGKLIPSHSESLERIRTKLQSQIELIDKTGRLGRRMNANLVVPIESLLADLLKLESKCKEQKLAFVVDPLLEPLFDSNKSKLASTFYENRYGFSANHLLESKFSDRTHFLKVNR